MDRVANDAGVRGLDAVYSFAFGVSATAIIDHFFSVQAGNVLAMPAISLLLSGLFLVSLFGIRKWGNRRSYKRIYCQKRQWHLEAIENPSYTEEMKDQHRKDLLELDKLHSEKKNLQLKRYRLL
jgi:hypothetical protein